MNVNQNETTQTKEKTLMRFVTVNGDLTQNKSI
jgi:hypothetical protein